MIITRITSTALLVITAVFQFSGWREALNKKAKQELAGLFDNSLSNLGSKPSGLITLNGSIF